MKRPRLFWKFCSRCILAVALAVRLATANHEPAAKGHSEAREDRTLPMGRFDPALSPDGNQVAFAWSGDIHENYSIYVERVGSHASRRLTTNPSAEFNPAWSPDGRYIAFCRQGPTGAQIFMVSAAGGRERRLGECASNRPRLAWSPDGKFLAVVNTSSPESSTSIFLLSTGTGKKHRLTVPPMEAAGDDHPAFSPDGRTVAFVRTLKNGSSNIYFQPLTGEATPSSPPQRLDIAFPTTRDKVAINGLDWTGDGSSLIFSSGGLWKVSVAGGKCLRLPAEEEGEIGSLSVSRQGRRVAYVEYAPEMELWRTAGPGSKPEEFPPTRLVESLEEMGSPNVSWDGKQITWGSFRSGSWEIWKCDKEGKNLVQLTFLGNIPTGSPRWSPDGNYVVFDGRAEDGGLNDIYVVDANGGTARRLTTEPSVDIRPCYSRDQQWIYFTSNRTGNFQIWKMPAGGGKAVQITKKGGFVAFESPDGKFLYYGKSRNDHSLWKVPVEGGEETKVLNNVDPSNFATCDLGICVLNMEEGLRPVVEFYSYATQKRIPLKVLPPEGTIWPGGTALGVARDGRWLVFTREGVIAGHIRTLDY
jgi:Tol biopolymer transport system component